MEPYRLHKSLGYHLSIAARLQERRLDDGLKSLGLTRTTWCILLAVGNEGLSQPSDIADFIGIDRTATSRALKTMEKDGLVTRASGQDDKRTRQIGLTRKSAALIARGTELAKENNAFMKVKLGEHEAETLKTLLANLIEGESTELSNF